MKSFLHAIAITFAASIPAMAQQTAVVVELYTSQGCSSCPPADEMMAVLAEREDVIALSLHVDYWDYIGWKDEFADPRHAKRQRGYAMEAGRRSVYTPEMIVNGTSDIVGAKPMKLATAIDKHKGDAKTVELKLTRNGDMIAIDAKKVSGSQAAMTVHMVRYQPRRKSNITRGENAGRTLEYVNVAQDWQQLTTWNGDEPLQIEAAAPGDWPIVVLVQRDDYGPILAAGRID